MNDEAKSQRLVMNARPSVSRVIRRKQGRVAGENNQNAGRKAGLRATAAVVQVWIS